MLGCPLDGRAHGPVGRPAPDNKTIADFRREIGLPPGEGGAN